MHGIARVRVDIIIRDDVTDVVKCTYRNQKCMMIETLIDSVTSPRSFSERANDKG